MAVLKPLRVVIDNYPEGQVEEVEAINNPEDPNAGTRLMPFSRELFIERDDFQEEPHRKFFRLAPGREVRLKHAYFITCDRVVKDETTGEIIELRCSYDPESRGGDAPDGRRVKGTLHWVSAQHSIEAEVRLFDHLLLDTSSDGTNTDEDFKTRLNPDSLETLTSCRVERSLESAKSGDFFQFLRNGYFTLDPKSAAAKMVFNRSVGLRDSWSKIAKKS